MNQPPVPKPRPTAASPAGAEARDTRGGVRRGDVAEVAIEKLVFGGDGLARIAAQVVFVPFAAPGDVLRIRVTEVGRGFVRGAIVEIVKPGPSRRDPRCRHFGVCGGCTLQHVDYAAQVEAKAEFVRESLRRLGGIDWTAEIPVRTGAEYGYRARAELQARRGHVGWFRAGTHEIVDVDECPVLVPEAEALLAGLRAGRPRHAVHIAVGDDGVATADPRTTVHRRVAGLDFEVAPDAFFQGNRLLADALVEDATAGASGACAVDLYAGAGLAAEAALVYERWVERCRAAVEKESSGRCGYVHVRGMNEPSFRRTFSEVLGRHSDAEALIVDTRFNGGGWLHDDLCGFLNGRDYLDVVPRGKARGEFGSEPFARWSRPVVVLMGEGNYSDAHLFPYAFKALAIGKLVGAPVAGTGTAVWWETLIDPSIVFGIPQVGMMGTDGKFMENQELAPDVLVYCDPKDVALGRDAQLLEAVRTVLAEPKRR